MALHNRTLRAAYGADLETRANRDHHADLRLWLRVMTVHKLIGNEIRRRLRGEFGMSLARFDLMAQLERNPGGLKMNELSQRLMVTGGNVTGITDQLEKEGLVVRASDPADRRAFTVKLTPTGRAVFAKMAAVHEQWVIELFAGLSAAEKDQVHRLLAKLKLGLQKPVLAATNNKEEKSRWGTK